MKKSMNLRSVKASLCNGLTLLTLSTIFISCGKNEKKYTQLPEPVKLSSEIPVDVDPVLRSNLISEGNIYELNKEYNKYSWQAFMAIMWPRDKQGKALSKFNDNGDPTWLGWKEAFQVFRADGAVPANWGSTRTRSGLGLSDNHVNDADARILLSSFTPTGRKSTGSNTADETDQAFAGKLFDQNGNVVVYEVLMNKPEYDYLIKNKLYNINGQIDFSKNGSIANFPKGDYEANKVGAVEIKFAWKILEDTDIKERYLVDEGYVLDDTTNEYKKTDIGLIGMHISQKTPSGKQWVWSTFEHVDNLRQNVTKVDGKEVLIHPTLRDPECEICPANVDVSAFGSTNKFHTGVHGDYRTISGDTLKYYANEKTVKTQVKRMVDIPVRVASINKKMQAYFKSQNSFWQYYELIDTQYPLDQDVAPGGDTRENYKIPESATNKPGGKPNLALLTNMTMETFFQNGNEDATNLIENNLADKAGNSPTTMQVYGTESCMGCHSSAGIYHDYSFNKQGKIQFNTLDQLSGDFSWLLSQKAHWNKSIPLPTK